MMYDLKADAFKMLNRIDEEDRYREVARQRLVREALAGHQKRYTNPIPGLLDWLRKLAKQESRITTEPAS